MHLQIRMCPAINELAFPYVVDQVLVRDLGLREHFFGMAYPGTAVATPWQRLVIGKAE